MIPGEQQAHYKAPVGGQSTENHPWKPPIANRGLLCSFKHRVDRASSSRVGALPSSIHRVCVMTRLRTTHGWHVISKPYITSSKRIDHEHVPQVLEQTPTSQPVEPTHARVSSQLPKHSLSVGGASHASTKSRSTGVDPPMLDLRALSLNRAGPSKAPSRLLLDRETTSRTSTPPAVPPVKLEDDEMEDVYGRPLGLLSPYASTPPQRGRPHWLSPSLRYSEESGPLLFLALAAKDPNVLAMLERHEQRQAARPRQGMRKVQAVHGAGKKRRWFLLVENRTKAETALAAERAVERASRWMTTIY